MSELIILCRPEELDEACRSGYRAACAAWRVGDDGRLWRSPLPRLRSGSIMAICGGENTGHVEGDIAAECTRLGIGEVLWLADGTPPAGKGYRLLQPLSTAISGGSIGEYLKGEAAVIIEPMRHYFTLPSRDGNGTPINGMQLEKCRAAAKSGGFSRELGCKYLIWEGGCVLYDDAESIGGKIKLLRQLNVGRIILPYSSERIKVFLRARP